MEALKSCASHRTKCGDQICWCTTGKYYTPFPSRNPKPENQQRFECFSKRPDSPPESVWSHTDRKLHDEEGSIGECNIQFARVYLFPQTTVVCCCASKQLKFNFRHLKCAPRGWQKERGIVSLASSPFFFVCNEYFAFLVCLFPVHSSSVLNVIIMELFAWNWMAIAQWTRTKTGAVLTKSLTGPITATLWLRTTEVAITFHQVHLILTWRTI